MEQVKHKAEIIVVGGGIAGLSAAIYLRRAERDTLVIDLGKSMARWEPAVENYLGFPAGIAGAELLRRGRKQAARNGVRMTEDEIQSARKRSGGFLLRGRKGEYEAKRLLIATGIYHVPPDVEGVPECLGHSMFFCKDCDGFRVKGKRTAICGWTNEAVEYALALTYYSAHISVVTNGHRPRWDKQHALWLREYEIPVYQSRITRITRRGCRLKRLRLANREELPVEALFTTRGDVYFNQLARCLGARVDEEGQVMVDGCMRTNVQGLYAAGCVTPANCQMIIAAGQGAAAAQAINRDLFEESLATHSLRRFRNRQLGDLRTSGASVDRKGVMKPTRGEYRGSRRRGTGPVFSGR